MTVNESGRIVVIGAGPTGLGAAYRLQEVDHPRWFLFEAGDRPGGLAASYEDNEGFTWDVGGHVHFSHYDYYDEVVNRVLGDRRLFHERRAWIRSGARWIPYPFQYNLHRLPPEAQQRAVAGLEEAEESRDPLPRDFRGWINRTFGHGLAELFMLPYNRKVWGFPLHTLGVEWISERVAMPDLERVKRNIDHGIDDVSWGPNKRFFYPQQGGSGATWQGVLGQLDREGVSLRSRVTSVHPAEKRIDIADGGSVEFDVLISTMPLDVLCSLCSDLDPQIRAAARSLVHSSVHVVGVGLRHGIPEALKEACWIYFPDPETPFHRATVLSNYSPHNVPKGKGYWSLMVEVCETPFRPVAEHELVDQVLAGMVREELLDERASVVSIWHHREEHGYPTPFLGRDEVLDQILPELEKLGIFSRGRFGAWRYEVSNQDHAFMQGVEVVDRLLGLGREVTLNHPELVNR